MRDPLGHRRFIPKETQPRNISVPVEGNSEAYGTLVPPRSDLLVGSLPVSRPVLTSRPHSLFKILFSFFSSFCKLFLYYPPFSQNLCFLPFRSEAFALLLFCLTIKRNEFYVIFSSTCSQHLPLSCCPKCLGVFLQMENIVCFFEDPSKT